MKEINEIKYLVEYHPWRDGNNLKFDNNSSEILNLKKNKNFEIKKFSNMLIEELKNLPELDEIYAIAVIPSHEKGAQPSGIRNVARKVSKKLKINFLEFDLKRKYTIDKKSKGGLKNIEIEIESLVFTPSFDIRDKIILLLDDVTTSGTSLNAGATIIMKESRAKVIKLAIAKTTY